MRYRIILPDMVEITPVCALVYMVHVLVTMGVHAPHYATIRPVDVNMMST